MIMRTELINIIKTHLEKYPKMELEDFLKLIFQNSHGPKHLDILKVKENFRKELQDATLKKNYVEYIGNDYYRVYFNKLWDEDTINKVLDAFIKSNQNSQVFEQLFNDEIDDLIELINLKKVSLSSNDITLIRNYQEKDNHMISHSLLYKQLYNPHYILIHKNYLYYLFEKKFKK